MKINSEKGQALPLVMIAVVLGALVVPPFLGYADSSIIGSRHYAGALYSEYACDAGVEDAIWKLTDGGWTNNLTAAGSMVSYTLNESINSLLTNVKICNAWMPIASDNFESHSWSGGTGWTDNWTHTIDVDYADVVNSTTQYPSYDGSHHLRLQRTGMAKRSLDLSHQSDIHLRFFAKASSFEPGDSATCQVSSDGVNWDVVHTWNYGDEDVDGMYHYCDIDLRTFEMTSRFWISFNGAMSSTGDHLFIDKIDLVWLIADPVVFAWDYFEGGSGNWSGGGGWTANWTHSSYTSAEITDQGGPAYEGEYHLRLQYNDGYARRPTNLSDADTPRLRFAAKARLRRNEYAYGEVSSNNGTTWNRLLTWSSNNASSSYKYFDYGLNQFPLTSNFWVRFRIDTTQQSSSAFYVDKLEIVNLDMFGIMVKAGDSMVRVILQIEDGVVTILSWYYV